MSADKPSSSETTLVSGASVYLASNAFTAALSLALLPALTRYLSPSEYGEVAMFQTLVAAFGSVVGLNAVAAASRRYYDGATDDGLRDFIAACLQILVASACVALVVVLAWGEPIAALVRLDARWLPWTVFVAATTFVIQLRLTQWQVRRQAWRYAALQSGEGMGNALLTVLLVMVLVLGAQGRIASLIISGCVFAVIALVLMKRERLLRLFVWRGADVGEALRFGVPLVPHVAAGFVLVGVDRVVVGAQLGLAEAGIYMLASQLALALGLLLDAVNKSYVPWLFERLRDGEPRLRRQIVRYTYAWFCLLLAGAALCFAFGPWLVRIVAGERYAAAGEIVAWLVLAQVFSGMYMMVTNYIFYAKRTGLLSLVTVGASLLNVLLLLALVPRMGMKGAALAVTISMAGRFLLTWWAAQRSHPMPWFRFREGARPASP